MITFTPLTILLLVLISICVITILVLIVSNASLSRDIEIYRKMDKVEELGRARLTISELSRDSNRSHHSGSDAAKPKLRPRSRKPKPHTN